MRRALAIGWIASLAACAGSREVSKIRYTSTECPDPKGCEAPLGEQAYQLPDDDRDPVADAAAMSEAPSCKTVAVALAAIELGNYSSEETDDERATIIATHQRTCEVAKLDARELACLSTVTDAKHVGYCTRKMGAPTLRVPMLSATACRDAIDEIRPNLQTAGRVHAPMYEASCIEDGWSVDLASCMRQQGWYQPSECRTQAPGWVIDRLQARIDGTAMQ
ncbi:MAG: hypothetical protein ACKV2T_42735 [Kofleriaceae bacterium]